MKVSLLNENKFLNETEVFDLNHHKFWNFWMTKKELNKNLVVVWKTNYSINTHLLDIKLKFLNEKIIVQLNWQRNLTWKLSN